MAARSSGRPRGSKNFWLNEGHSFGITAAGGAGWQLAHWIVDGEPTIDMMGVDPRRFGDYAGFGYLKAKNEEAYAKVFTVHYPDEEREAARGLRRTPCYDRMKAKGAVFGTVFGWERPNWFAPEGYALTEDELGSGDVLLSHNYPVADGDAPILEKWSFRRSNYFEHVGAEIRHLTEHAGLLDMSAFAKCEIAGPGAEAWLDGLLTNAVPKKIGRVTLSYLLTANGGVRSEFTVYKLGPQRYYLVSAGAYEKHDHDYLRKLMPRDGSVTLRAADDGDGRARARGPEGARHPRQADHDRPLDRGVPVADRQDHLDRRGAGRGTAGQLRRRTRLGDPSPDRDAELHLRPAVRGRRRRPQAVRHPGDGFDAARERLQADPARAFDRVLGLRERARALHRLEEAGLPRTRRAARGGAKSRTRWSRSKSTASPMQTRAAPSRS